MINFSQLMHHGYLSEQSGINSKQPAFSIAQMDLPSNLKVASDRSHASWDLHNDTTNLEGNITAAGSTFTTIEGSFSIPTGTNVLLISEANVSYTPSELNDINTWFNDEKPRLIWLAGDSDYLGNFTGTPSNELLEYVGTNLRLGTDSISDPINNDGAVYRVAAQTPVSDGAINSILTTDVSSAIFHAPCSVLGYNVTDGTVVDLAQSSMEDVEVIMKGSSEVYSQDLDFSDGEFDYYATNNINGSYPLMAIQTMGHKKYVIVSGEVIFSDYQKMYALETRWGLWNGGVQDGKTLVDNVFSWFGKEVSTLDVACVFSLSLDDPYNAIAYNGLLKAQNNGLCTFDYSIPSTVEEIEILLDSFASTGNYDLIIAVGFQQKTAVDNVAASYPSQPIFLIDEIAFQGNVSSLKFKENEGSFLVGAMAGLMTQTGKIGFVSGADYPLIRKFWAGFEAGVLYVRNNSFTEVVVDFVGTPGDPPSEIWNNPAEAKVIAESMWSQGVDIIYAAAGNSGDGVHESANEQGPGFYSIGVDKDQDSMFPGSVLTSMMKRLDLAVYQVIEDLYSGSWITGHQEKGIAEDGVGISPLTYTRDIIGEAIIEEVNVTLRNKIATGELSVPNNSTSLIQWIDDMNLVTPIFPDFNELVDYGFSHIAGDDYQFTATIRNTGDPVPAGPVTISWEEYYYELPLDNGEGTLDESLADYDINGDGDRLDSFDVAWSPSETRPYDAIVDGMYVYSRIDVEDNSRSYYIDGEPKLFQIGSETHLLYRADNDIASFGFNSVFRTHPSPNLELVLYSDVSVSDFKINGLSATVDYSWTYVEQYADGSIYDVSVYVFSNNDILSIAAGEEVTMSCTLTPHGIGTPFMCLVVNWSPDGNFRKLWIPFAHEMTLPSFTASIAGETLSGEVEIYWTEAGDNFEHEMEYDLYYSPNAGTTWIELTSRFWDTTTVADGSNYLLKLVATCSEGFYVEVVTDGTLIIQNQMTAMTTTEGLPGETTTEGPPGETTTEGAPSVDTPGLTGLILLVTIGTLTIRRKKRKNEF